MKLIADAMLGALARWLRALGYDVLYDPHLSDNQLVRLAREEGRVLLTRDTGLLRRRNLSVLFIRSQDWPAQVRQVLRELPLPAPAPLTRCLECNEPLEHLPRTEAWGLVPPYVFVRHSHFRICPACERIYWQGTHWDRMQRTIEELCAYWEHCRRETAPLHDDAIIEEKG